MKAGLWVFVEFSWASTVYCVVESIHGVSKVGNGLATIRLPP